MMLQRLSEFCELIMKHIDLQQAHNRTQERRLNEFTQRLELLDRQVTDLQIQVKR